MMLTFFFAMVMNTFRIKNENILGDGAHELDSFYNENSYIGWRWYGRFSC